MLYLCPTHQSVTSEEENFNNQVDRMPPSVDTGHVILFLATRWSSPNGLIHTECPWWTGWRLDMSSATWTFTHKSLPVCGHYSGPNFPATKTNTRVTDVAPSPSTMSQLPAGRLITLDCCHHGNGSVLFFLQ